MAGRNVYLVGSVSMANAEQVFETLSAALGRRIKHIPDGETGERGDWITWLEPVFANSPALTLAEVKSCDVGRLKPGSRDAANFPEQRQLDGLRIPTLAEVFDLARRSAADHVRFNIETKLTPTSDPDTPDPETFASAVAAAVRAAGLTARVSVQSFDWRTLVILRRIAPEIERVCLTVDGGSGDTLQRGRPGPSPWTAGLDIDDFDGSVPRLVAAAGCSVWSPYFPNVIAPALAQAKAIGLKVIPWTVNERAEMERLIALGVDGIITDYPNRLRALLIEKEIPVPPEVAAR